MDRAEGSTVNYQLIVNTVVISHSSFSRELWSVSGSPWGHIPWPQVYVNLPKSFMAIPLLLLVTGSVLSIWCSSDPLARQEATERSQERFLNGKIVSQERCNPFVLLDIVVTGHESQYLCSHLATMWGTNLNTKPSQWVWQNRRWKELGSLMMALICWTKSSRHCRVLPLLMSLLLKPSTVALTYVHNSFILFCIGGEAQIYSRVWTRLSHSLLAKRIKLKWHYTTSETISWKTLWLPLPSPSWIAHGGWS